MQGSVDSCVRRSCWILHVAVSVMLVILPHLAPPVACTPPGLGPVQAIDLTKDIVPSASALEYQDSSGNLSQYGTVQSNDPSVRIIDGDIVRPSRGVEESPSTAMKSSTLSPQQTSGQRLSDSQVVQWSSFGAQPKRVPRQWVSLKSDTPASSQIPQSPAMLPSLPSVVESANTGGAVPPSPSTPSYLGASPPPPPPPFGSGLGGGIQQPGG